MIADEDAVTVALQKVRLMNRFFADVVDADPRFRAFLPELHCAYMEMLNEDLRPDALALAVALLDATDNPSPVTTSRRRRRR